MVSVARAGGVGVARPAYQRAGGGAKPTPALQSPALFRAKNLVVRGIPTRVASEVCCSYHYLHSYPGGSLINLGVFAGARLEGVVVIGVGPANLHRLFRGAEPQEVACLSRFWLSDACGPNSESRVLAVILSHLRRDQERIKAVVAYSDPQAGHDGGIYRAAGFLFIGQSEGVPQYRAGDGKTVHSRTLSHGAGTHSVRFFREHGIEVEVVPQNPKWTYVALVDGAWRFRLTSPVLPYLRKDDALGDH